MRNTNGNGYEQDKCLGILLVAQYSNSTNLVRSLNFRIADVESLMWNLMLVSARLGA